MRDSDRATHALVLAVALLLGGGTLAAFLVRAEKPKPTPVSPGPGARDVARVESRVDAASALVARLESQDARLEALERRVNEQNEQLVNFQIFVRKLVVQQGRPASQEKTAPVREAPSRALPPQPFGALRPGDPSNAVLADLGKPDETREEEDGSAELRYYDAGVAVTLDSSGLVREVYLYGEPTGGGPIDANGNRTGLFDQKGRWFRPNGRSVGGVRMGMTGLEVMKLLGPSPDVESDYLGHLTLRYPDKGMALVLSTEAPYRVIGIRLEARDR